MIKRLLIVAALAVTVSGVAVVPDASADTPRCVSRKEYRAVKKGWTMPRVHDRFDVKGRRAFIMDGYQSREYRACTVSSGVHGTVWVEYERSGGTWRVTNKMAVW